MFALFPLLEEKRTSIQGLQDFIVDEDSNDEPFIDEAFERWHEKFSYDQNWFDLYHAFTLWCLEQQHGFRLLCHLLAFGQARIFHPSLPSVVPDWSQSRQYLDSLPGPVTLRSQPFKRGPVPHDMLKIKDNTIIMLEAYGQGQVLHLVEIQAPGTGPQTIRKLLEQFLRQARRHISCTGDGDNTSHVDSLFAGMPPFYYLLCAISKILCASPRLFEHDSIFHIDPSYIHRDSIAAKIELWLEHLLEGVWNDAWKSQHHFELVEATEDMTELMSDTSGDNIPTRVDKLLQNYSLYQLCNGIVGLSPRGLRKGDWVVDFPDGQSQGEVVVPAPHNSYLFIALRPMVYQLGVLCKRGVRPAKSQILGPCFSSIRLQSRHITRFELC